MKIRTDFVTNSSSSSYVTTLVVYYRDKQLSTTASEKDFIYEDIDRVAHEAEYDVNCEIDRFLEKGSPAIVKDTDKFVKNIKKIRIGDTCRFEYNRGKCKVLTENGQIGFLSKSNPILIGMSEFKDSTVVGNVVEIKENKEKLTIKVTAYSQRDGKESQKYPFYTDDITEICKRLYDACIPRSRNAKQLFEDLENNINSPEDFKKIILLTEGQTAGEFARYGSINEWETFKKIHDKIENSSPEQEEVFFDELFDLLNEELDDQSIKGVKTRILWSGKREDVKELYSRIIEQYGRFGDHFLIIQKYDFDSKEVSKCGLLLPLLSMDFKEIYESYQVDYDKVLRSFTK